MHVHQKTANEASIPRGDAMSFYRRAAQAAFMLALSMTFSIRVARAQQSVQAPLLQSAWANIRLFETEGELGGSQSLLSETRELALAFQRLRAAGNTRDRSAIPALRAALSPVKDAKEPPDTGLVLAALHSLAQLGAVEALSDVEAVMNRSGSPYPAYQEKNYARIARARLLAEAGDKRPLPKPGRTLGTNPLPPPEVTVIRGVTPGTLSADGNRIKQPPRFTARKLSAAEQNDLRIARTKLARYLKELSIGVEDLNHVRAAREAQAGIVDGSSPEEQRMLRELADMIYQKHDIALAQACEEAGVEFEQDAMARLKVNLAPYSREKRIKALVAHLAQIKILGGYEDYVMQLLVNEGAAGSNAAAEQLKFVQKNRGEYTRASIVGFFRVIEGVGDTAQADLVRSFSKDDDKMLVGYVTQYLPGIESGTPKRRISIY